MPVNFAKPSPDSDINAGADESGRAARRLVEQWRNCGYRVPPDAAYLIAAEIRQIADERNERQHRLREIGRMIGCEHVHDPDGRARLVSCLRTTLAERH